MHKRPAHVGRCCKPGCSADSGRGGARRCVISVCKASFCIFPAPSHTRKQGRARRSRPALAPKKSAYTRSSAEKTAVPAQSTTPPSPDSPTPRHTCIPSTPGHMASQTDRAANSAGFIGLTEPLSCGSRHNGLCRNVSTPFLLQQSEAGGGRARARQDKGPTVG